MAMLLTSGWTSIQAADLPALIERAKPSVVLVGTYGPLDSPRFGFRGTGFVVGNGRQIVTSAHVLPVDLPARTDRRLVVQTYGDDRKWSQRDATVLAIDQVHDLALLNFEGKGVPPLALAGEQAGREGRDVALMGFPIGGALGFSHVTHRGIVAARTAIALPAPAAQALNERAIAQLRHGAFEILQLDITAYPGNSGGPVFDLLSGEVVGVVSMVLVKGTRESALSAPTGISYAVPIRHVTLLLNSLP